MTGAGPFRLSTSTLAAIVAISVVAALLILTGLVMLLLLRSDTGSPASAESGSLISQLPGLVDSGITAGEVPAIADPGQWLATSAQATPSALRPKPIIGGVAFSRPRWTATPVPTHTPTPTPTPNPTFVSSAYGLGNNMPDGIAPGERWIDVSLAEQKLVAYDGLVPVFETLVSTGTARHPTVTGQFRIWLRFQSQDMNGYRLGYDYYLKDVPYVQYFYEDYALHGTFWHSNFGNPMSHGCVNLSTADAEWLYNWAGYGTLVNVHP